MFTHCGKEVLCNGKHYADAVDDTEAALIVAAMNEFFPEGYDYED